MQNDNESIINIDQYVNITNVYTLLKVELTFNNFMFSQLVNPQYTLYWLNNYYK